MYKFELHLCYLYTFLLYRGIILKNPTNVILSSLFKKIYSYVHNLPDNLWQNVDFLLICLIFYRKDKILYLWIYGPDSKGINQKQLRIIKPPRVINDHGFNLTHLFLWNINAYKEADTRGEVSVTQGIPVNCLCVVYAATFFDAGQVVFAALFSFSLLTLDFLVKVLLQPKRSEPWSSHASLLISRSFISLLQTSQYYA